MNDEDVFSERVIRPGNANSALYNFMPATKLKGMEDWVEEDDQFKYLEQSSEFTADIVNDDTLLYPPILKAFMFPRGDISRFPRPKRSSLGTSSTTLKKFCFFGSNNWVCCNRLLFNGCRVAATSFSAESGADGQRLGSVRCPRRKILSHTANSVSK